MKKYRIETVSSIDNKIDVKDITVEGDKFSQGENWVMVIVPFGERMRKLFIPREQIKRIEELSE